MERGLSIPRGLRKEKIVSPSELKELWKDPKKRIGRIFVLSMEEILIDYQEKDEPQMDLSLQPRLIKEKIIDSPAELCAMLNDPKLLVLSIDDLNKEQLLITYYNKPQPQSSHFEPSREKISTGNKEGNELTVNDTHEQEEENGFDGKE
jgi:hypothetical protein